MQYQFTDDCLTGIPHIDDEHRMLFELVNNVELDLKDGFDVKDILKALLPRLIEYADFHFKDEEEYMSRIHYEGLEAQKISHEAFVAKLKSINMEELDENQGEYLNNLIQFLLSWLSNHILKMDKLIPNK